MAIKAGDTIYALKQIGRSWYKFQYKLTVDEVTTVPTMKSRQRARFYKCHLADGTYIGTYHNDYIDGKVRQVVRKTPYPRYDIVETGQQECDQYKESDREHQRFLDSFQVKGD